METNEDESEQLNELAHVNKYPALPLEFDLS